MKTALGARTEQDAPPLKIGWGALGSGFLMGFLVALISLGLSWNKPWFKENLENGKMLLLTKNKVTR